MKNLRLTTEVHNLFIFGKRDVDAFLKQLRLPFDPHYYGPCSNIEIIKRVLRNLIGAYEKAGSMQKAAELEQLQAILEDTDHLKH